MPQRQRTRGFHQSGHGNLIRLITAGWFSLPCFLRALKFVPSLIGPGQEGKGADTPKPNKCYLPLEALRLLDTVHQ